MDAQYENVRRGGYRAQWQDENGPREQWICEECFELFRGIYEWTVA